MPNIKFSQLSVASSLLAADTFFIVQNGTNKKTTLATILNNLVSTSHIRVNPTQVAINFSVGTSGDANALTVIGTTNRVGVGIASPDSKFHVNGNAQVGSAAADGVLVQSTETITYTSSDQTNVLTKAISPVRAMSSIDCNTGVNGLFSLSTGFNGQIKTIFQNTLDVGKTSTITVTGLGFNTITFDAVGDCTVLQYNTAVAKWVIIGGNGAAYSTV